MVDTALATAMHAMRTNVVTTLEGSPGSLVFSCNMYYNVLLIADWHMLMRRCEHHVSKSLHRQNCCHHKWDYAMGQKVLKKVFEPTKIGPQTTGPYVIPCVHVNGNVTVQLQPEVTERLNIRRAIPYREPTQ